MKRTLATLAAGAAIAAGVSLAAAPAASAAPVPHWASLGDHLLLPPSPDGVCHGTVFADLQTSPNPDVVTVNLIPTGTYGSHPQCDVDVRFGVLSGLGSQSIDATVSGGPTTVDVHAGRGLSMLTVSGTNPFGMGGGGYVWLQP